MRRATDRLIALQFLAVAVPIAFVLLGQMAADARRAAALEQSRPLRTLANEARANYRTFTNGAADAVDTGALGRQSAEALGTTAALLQELAGQGETHTLGNTPKLTAELAAQVRSGATLETLMALRGQIAQADRDTRAIDELYERRDAAVVQDAVESARRQKQQVSAALFISSVLTVIFVLATRRRLKWQIEADAAIERQRRAELERISIRFEMASRAARAGVYELHDGDCTVWWSDTMKELYGQPPQASAPTFNRWLELIHPADRAATQDAMLMAMRDRKQLRAHYRVVRPDGGVSHIESVAAVINDLDSGGVRLVGIDLDVTGRVAAQRREDALQLQLRDASRQAGMADVATSVLHNVGNVLNSVNVSASLVADSVKRSRVASLARVVSVVNEHQTDFGNFVANDERGRALPAYLTGLSRQLNAENHSVLLELQSLRGNIDHIKDIVAMQQRYAKLSGVADVVNVRALIEESLRITANAYERHAVKVVRRFGELPEITVDKHKVLQILVNLLRNAKDACDGNGERERRVTIVAEPCELGVRITLSDTGNGIAPENMHRLFTHGFTTKPNGHGFGLHSSALAAREIGGVLRAESAGVDCGATFILELPLTPPREGT